MNSRLNLISGLLPISAIALVAVFGPFMTEYNPTRADPTSILLPPSTNHWLGTNNYGGDIFSRLVHAARLDLVIGFGSVAIAFAIGTPLGAIAGYSQARWSGLLMRFMDFVQSFPLFILALALVSVVGASLANVVAVIVVLSVPIFVRLVRAEVLGLRQRSFVEAAQCVGNSDMRIVLRHILPNAISSSLAQASAQIGWALLMAAGLGFVGAGIRPPTPEWGVMIGEGAGNMISGGWWVALFPGIALGLTVLSFAMAGDVIRDMMDVRLREAKL